MDMQNVIYAVAVLFIMGIVFAILLGVAAKVFAVEVDERVPLVRECLPGANCGGCGFPGCDGLAAAIVEGRAPVNGCPVGGAAAAEKIAKVLGVEVAAGDRQVAHVYCNGGCNAKDKANYEGLQDCNAAMRVASGPKACSFGCMGLGSCVKACAFDAIHIVDGVAKVDTDKCVACGKCVEVCPAGAAKLGQKLCTKDGPVVYPKQPLPDDNHWGEHMWDVDYKNNNQKNCHESGTAPCKAACPAHIAVQGYIKMAGEGRYLDALKLIKQDNPFPAVCGSICNRRCEDACTRGQLDRAVAIDEIKKFIAEKELSEKTRYIPEKRRHKTPDTDYVEKIAIIGAGPAGMSCAYYLAEMGYANVTVFDRNPVPGGMLTLGIPSFRLERKVINAEIDVLKKMGVKFKCGVEVGKDITIDELRKQGYKGFFVAIGAQKSAKLGITGEELKGVYGGVVSCFRLRMLLFSSEKSIVFE